MSELIRELTQLQQRDGWLSPDGLRELAARLNLPLHRLESASTFYSHFRRTKPAPIEIEVCRDISCWLAGGREAAERMRGALDGRDDVAVREVSCLGRCDRAPAAAVDGQAFASSDAQAVAAALQGNVAPLPHASREWGEADLYADGTRKPYSTLHDALLRDPAALAGQLTETQLRGMGGAGFPTGRKWSLVAAESNPDKVVICNADESEPGTFKDREILRHLPDLVIEGMALAAHCIGARKGWVFIRHEYEPERQRLAAAIERARKAGALGPGALGAGRDFDVEIFVSPGGYILGEETALIECMEGRRGEPRNKPPYPGTHGLYGAPTLMNNVETFAHATAILARGVEWWQSLGAPGFAGHKFIAVSGDVVRPGVELVPVGSTLRELLERVGGMRDGRALAAIAPGGASSRFLSADALEVEIDFEALERAGSMLGSGAVVFVAEGTDLLQAGANVTRFFRNESCGKCVPCRVGTEKAVAIVEAAPGLSARDHERLTELDATLQRTSICGLGQVALGPLLSILERFPETVGGD